MKYRRFGKLNWEVSALGFGAMRLPVIDNDRTRINESEAIQMIHYAIDHGVNYLDTAWPYHGGNSEVLVGKALKNGYREKIKLATKLPSRFVETAKDFDRFLNEQLTRLQTDSIDFYLFHGLNKKSWPKLLNLNVFEWAEKAVGDGRVVHLGFSFHDELSLFKEIVDAYEHWTLCQIQYNYLDTEYQAGTKGLRYASAKGLAVVVMEPIRGGMLAKNPPKEVLRLWETAPVMRSPAEWALQWVWDQPEAATVLSGMSTMDHVVENVNAAGRSWIGMLSKSELSLINQVKEIYASLKPIPCTICNYCMPCPSNVNISKIIDIYNDAFLNDDQERARLIYGNQIGEDERASLCTECLECEKLCPQEIVISEWLKKAQALLEK